jgi:hypothetical protein
MRSILRQYDTGEMIELRIRGEMIWKHDRSKILYAEMAQDLRLYIHDKTRTHAARMVALMAARIAELEELTQDMLHVALDDSESLEVRVPAAVGVRMIGDDGSRAALKPLLALEPEDDPNDDLRGAALAATWPSHLTADELFDALTQPRNTSRITEYRKFLTDHFELELKSGDILRALAWAGPHATSKSANRRPLGISALRVVSAAVDFFDEPDVCASLARIIVDVALRRNPSLELMSKLSSNRPARQAIARKAMEICDKNDLGSLVSYGLIDREDDIPFLLGELNTQEHA